MVNSSMFIIYFILYVLQVILYYIRYERYKEHIQSFKMNTVKCTKFVLLIAAVTVLIEANKLRKYNREFKIHAISNAAPAL